jgi:hypothetical protein
MKRRNSDAQPMGFVMLRFLRFMHGPTKRLHTLHRMGNERAALSGSDHPTGAALEEACLNPTFDLLELFTESRFAHSQTFGCLSHIAYFMQSNN